MSRSLLLHSSTSAALWARGKPSPPVDGWAAVTGPSDANPGGARVVVSMVSISADDDLVKDFAVGRSVLANSTNRNF